MRWVCGSCGAGTNAPARMRADDARRFCLGCTAASGRLVRRTCPVLERRRGTKAAKRAGRVTAQRGRVRRREAARWTVDGLDLRDEEARLWATGRGLGFADALAEIPVMRVRWSKVKAYSTGRAWTHHGRIVLTLGLKVDRAEAAVLLAHELAHMMAPRDEHHGPRFYRILSGLLESAYGVTAPRLPGGHETFVRQAAVVRASRWYLRTNPGGGEDRDPPPPGTQDQADEAGVDEAPRKAAE